MPVNRGRVRLLVAALRSGLYQQTKGRLHRTDGTGDDPEGWCCLGVASDVAHKFGLQVVRTQGDGAAGCEMFDGEPSYMPQSVMEWYEFDSHNPRLITPDGSTVAASTANDSGYVPKGDTEYKPLSLDEIGRMFRDTYLKKH